MTIKQYFLKNIDRLNVLSNVILKNIPHEKPTENLYPTSNIPNNQIVDAYISSATNNQTHSNQVIDAQNQNTKRIPRIMIQQLIKHLTNENDYAYVYKQYNSNTNVKIEKLIQQRIAATIKNLKTKAYNKKITKK